MNRSTQISFQSTRMLHLCVNSMRFLFELFRPQSLITFHEEIITYMEAVRPNVMINVNICKIYFSLSKLIKINPTCSVHPSRNISVSFTMSCEIILFKTTHIVVNIHPCDFSETCTHNIVI